MFKALTVVLMLFIYGCDVDESVSQKAPELLVYCGITMVNPIQEIAAIVEKEKGVKITITQGGSEDLYKSLAASHEGDLYLPGSASYRANHIQEGLLGEFTHVGYNQAAIVVRKGNPNQIVSDLDQFTRNDIGVVISSPETGSIGRETKRILSAGGIYDQVVANAVFLTTDSRNLNRALKDGEADLILNWRATAFFEENKAHMEVVDLDPAAAKPKKLLINRLTFSEHPETAQYFMDYAASDKGQAIFRKHGFLDNKTAF